MELEDLFWSDFNYSVSSFCCGQNLQSGNPQNGSLCQESIIHALTGEELEWCGYQAVLFVAGEFLTAQHSIKELKLRNAELEWLLSDESSMNNGLRKQMNQMKRIAEENDWKLQEQIVQANSLLNKEKSYSGDLKIQLANCQNQLIEVESFLNSNDGKFALQLEEQLAVSKLRIAELEEEKDNLELKVIKSGMKTAVNKENRINGTITQKRG
eukprot:gene6581-9047_t